MSTYELSQLRALLSLQQLDSLIQERQAALDTANSGSELEPVRARLVTAEEAHEALAQRTQVVRRDLRYQEQEVEKIRHEASTQERKLYGGAVRNPKEAAQMEQHIASLRRRSAEGEDRAVSLLLELDGLEAELAEAAAAVQAAQAALDEAQARLARRLDELDVQLPSLRQQRETAAVGLPAALLRQYETTCTRRGGIGVAAVVEGKCAVCRMAVPFMTLREIRQGELKTCDSCARIVVEAGGSA